MDVARIKEDTRMIRIFSGVISLALAIISIGCFVTHNVSDAIYALGLAIFVRIVSE